MRSVKNGLPASTTTHVERPCFAHTAPSSNRNFDTRLIKLARRNLTPGGFTNAAAPATVQFCHTTAPCSASPNGDCSKCATHGEKVKDVRDYHPHIKSVPSEHSIVSINAQCAAPVHVTPTPAAWHPDLAEWRVGPNANWRCCHCLQKGQRVCKTPAVVIIVRTLVRALSWQHQPH